MTIWLTLQPTATLEALDEELNASSSSQFSSRISFANEPFRQQTERENSTSKSTNPARQQGTPTPLPTAKLLIGQSLRR
jgi:hypothetical protein